jgi:SAM-dependent methyltransferase
MFVFPDEFFDDSRKHARCNARYERIISANLDAIAGKRILDLASNNGLWSYAALKAGASQVVGVEGRKELVEQAQKLLAGAGMTRFQFERGDIFDYLQQKRSFDTIFCLGVFYHVCDHYRLLSLIARQEPQVIIIDSGFIRSFRNEVWIKSEEPARIKNALAKYPDQPMELAGQVSLGMMIQMAWNLGYSCRPVIWRRSEIADPNAVKDYVAGRRFTVRLERTGQYSDPEWKEHWRAALSDINPKFLSLFDHATHDTVAERRPEEFSII